MAFNTSELIAYARSIADLQNTKFISEDDELVLINEAYRDVYSRYTESDGDYYTKEEVVTLDSTMIDPNANGKSYKIPLPADFYKLRFVDYNYGGNWNTCNKFSTSQRNQDVSVPMYRLINNTLWILAAPGTASQIKITYYIPPQELTTPKDDVVYNVTAELAIVTENPLVWYAGGSKQELIYVSDDNLQLIYLNQETGEERVLKELPDEVYSKFKCIYGFGNDIYYSYNTEDSVAVKKLNFRSPTAQESDLTFPSVISIENFTVFSIFVKDSVPYMLLYPTSIPDATSYIWPLDDVEDYTDLGELVSCYSEATMFNATTNSDIVLDIWIRAGGTGIQVVEGDYTIIENAEKFFYDPATTYLYYKLRGSSDLRRCTLIYRGTSLKYFVIPEDDTLVQENVFTFINTIEDYMLIIDEYDVVKAIDTTPDYVLDYPTNEVNEILAYTSAIAYARKQSDATKMGTLQARLIELWDRFWSVNKRDEYQFTRINNDYQRTTSNYWG